LEGGIEKKNKFNKKDKKKKNKRTRTKLENIIYHKFGLKMKLKTNKTFTRWSIKKIKNKRTKLKRMKNYD
jgi:hypothetical protein